MKRTFLIVGFIIFVSCHPSKMIYKSVVNPMIIKDSVSLEIGKGDLRYLGGFHYSVPLHITNKSNSTVYIDMRSVKIASISENIVSSYRFNYLSDSVIKPYSKEKIYLAFDNKKDTIDSIFFSNRRSLKKNHKFVMDLYFIVGDSIIKKEIVFKPK